MNEFRVYYSGACFERGDSAEQVKKRIHDRIDSLGEVLSVEATPIHPDLRTPGEKNYVVTFEGEIMVKAETQVKAENQAYDCLFHLGQISVAVVKKEAA